MREPLAVADAREIVVHFEAGALPCRLILPCGSRRWLLDVAIPEEGSGRPWILRWKRYARGRRQRARVTSQERLYSAEPLTLEMLEGIVSALLFVEEGSRARA